MPDYTSNDIVDIILVLGECHNNYRQAAVLYRNRFSQRQHPNHYTISKFVLRQRQRQRQKRQRRRINVPERNDPHVLAVLGMVGIIPHVSTRQIARELGISRSTILRILAIHNFHPYHITLTQQLTLNDSQRRLEFCRWAQTMLNRDRTFFRFVLFSDEATFHNTGQLNRHNSHYWSVENPYWYREVNHQHRWSLIVWCGILKGNLIGPYFFNENVNGNNYLHFVQQRLPELLEDIDLETRLRMFFQQDGAPAHWSRRVRHHLDLKFPGRWIGRGGPVSWCPRSPDLTSLDFFLWGYLKNIVYSTAPTTRENMMERITIACRSIPRNVLLSTVDSFERRVQLCIDNNGQVFEHLLRS